MRSFSGPQSPKTPQSKKMFLPGGAGPLSALKASPSMRPKTSPAAKGGARGSVTSNTDESSNIQVICRVRPFSAAEEAGQASKSVHVIDDSTIKIEEKEASTTFKYDRVFGTDTTQESVYDSVGKNTLEDFFKGFNGTILAYGQTGAGKSHTMFGVLKGAKSGLGLIPRMAENIFKHIAVGPADVQYTVGISLMEIYKEHIIDLLNPHGKSTEYVIHQDSVNGVYVKGLSHAFVSTPEEMDHIFWEGYQMRKKGATAMNSESSRSHAIFQVTLTQNNAADGEFKKSNLFLVDLAGSEKFDRAGSLGNTLEEAKKINQSLSTLGLVINSLTDPKCAYVPYRDSKLTRILQESLGGNSRTTLIVNVSPASTSTSESMSTLRFGTRAKNIRNSVHVNSELSMEQLKIRVELLEKLNHELESELNGMKKPSPQVLKSDPSSPSPFNPRDVPNPIQNQTGSTDEIGRKDAKIAQLEKELLEFKMNSLVLEHSEDLKLFKLESALHQINDKLKDVELMNENLKRHLIISERIIKHRDDKIEKLCSVVNDQQMQVNRESAHFESKLRVLKSKLDAQRFRETSRRSGHLVYDSLPTTSGSFLEDDDIVEHVIDHPNIKASATPTKDMLRDLNMTPTLSPASPKVGLNLRIVKPLRGGGQVPNVGTESHFAESV